MKMISTLILLFVLTSQVSAQYITNIVFGKFPEKFEGNPAIVLTHFASIMKAPRNPARVFDYDIAFMKYQ